MIDFDLIADKNLCDIAEKVLAGVPVSAHEALSMLATCDITGLGVIANHVRETLHGKRAFYGVNMNLNYTNVCVLRCPLCAFSCDQGDPGAYTYSIDEIMERVGRAVESGIDEVHMVGGLNPSLDIEYFESVLRGIKAIKPDIFIVAFTAAEYDYFAGLNNISLDDVFERFISAGLGALPGGGAEIFAPDKRQVIAPGKISGERWLEVMETAHRHGLKTNATLLYNHIETDRDIVDHLEKLRSLQDRTGGFKTFVPLQFHQENTRIRAARKETTGYTDVRLYAVARIFLHNIPHIKALWMYLGDRMAQVLLSYGVDDIGATYHYEKVVHSAGARTPDYGSEDFLRNLVCAAGMEPVRTRADYRMETGS